MILFVSHKLLRWMSPWLLLGLLGASIALSFCERFAFFILLPILLIGGIALAGALLPKTAAALGSRGSFLFRA